MGERPAIDAETAARKWTVVWIVLLAAQGLAPSGGTPLFHWLPTPQAAVLHEFLARSGILVRLFREPASLRFGLPADEAGWQRLAQALADYRKESA